MTRTCISDHGHLFLGFPLFLWHLTAEAGSKHTERVLRGVLRWLLIWILSAALSQLVVDPLTATDENSAHLILEYLLLYQLLT